MNTDNNEGQTKKFEWTSLVGVIPIIALVLGAMVTFFVQNSSLDNNVTANTTQIANLEKRTSILAERQHQLELQQSQLASKISETQAQMCSAEVVRNMMSAQEIGHMSIMWKQLFSQEFPSSQSYFPVVCSEMRNTMGR